MSEYHYLNMGCRLSRMPDVQYITEADLLDKDKLGIRLDPARVVKEQRVT